MEEYLSDLTQKQVINFCNGKLLGYATDFIIDVSCGRLMSMVLPGEGKLFGLKRCVDLIIPWEKICKIGNDAIIVDIGYSIPESEEVNCCKKRKKA